MYWILFLILFSSISKIIEQQSYITLIQPRIVITASRHG